MEVVRMKKKIIGFLVLAAAIAMGVIIAACSLDTAERVTVTFVDPGGNKISPVAIERGSSLGSKLPSNLTHQTEPFIFYGWFDGATQYYSDTPIGANLTLTACYSDVVATVSFVFTQTDGSGNVIQPASPVPNVIAIKGLNLGTSYPVDPRSKGWAFNGWLLDGEAFTITTPVPGDITLSASWVAKTEFTVTFNPGPGVTPVAPMKVYANECIDEWEVRFPPKPTVNPINPDAFFVAWLDDENREYTGRVPITRNLTVVGRWGLPPYIVNLKWAVDGGDIEEILSSPGDGYGDVDYEPEIREAWDSTAENPKWVIVNKNIYDIPYNTNRWRILYRIKFDWPSDFSTGFYTRYTIRARFYANNQGIKGFEEEGKFTPNNPADAAVYGETGLLHGVNSQSDDGWGQISWVYTANWNGGSGDAATMLQRYNLDRKGGTINDTWAPANYKDQNPPYLLIQTSDSYIGFIEVYQIVFHNGEWEHTVYEGEEPPPPPEEPEE